MPRCSQPPRPATDLGHLHNTDGFKFDLSFGQRTCSTSERDGGPLVDPVGIVRGKRRGPGFLLAHTSMTALRGIIVSSVTISRYSSALGRCKDREGGQDADSARSPHRGAESAAAKLARRV
jgi:hypothetical protein